jgi:hypothetical protein
VGLPSAVLYEKTLLTFIPWLTGFCSEEFYGPRRSAIAIWAMAATQVAIASISRIMSVVVTSPLFPARHVRRGA